MEDRNKNESPDSSRTLSTLKNIVALTLAIIGLIYSIAPFFGAFAFPFGILGILISGIITNRRIKTKQKKNWPIIGLVLSVLITVISLVNYQKHQTAVNVILGIHGVVDEDQAYEDALIIPKGSPLRDIVIDDQKRKRTEGKNKKTTVSKGQPNKDASTNIKEDEPTRPPGLDPNIGIIERKAPLNSYYYSLVDNLRIRSAPNTDGEISFRLRFGQQVEYLGEKSEQKEKMTIAGIERNDYWYKVCLIGGSRPEGWVYGGALINAASPFSKEQTGLIRPINFIRKDSLSKLIGRETYGNYTYTGIISCIQNSKGELIPDGRFYFDGYHNQSYYNMPLYGETERVRGKIKAGGLHGIFKEVIGLFETSISLEIEYNNGVCTSYKMISNAEGEIRESESRNPKDCSYNYIDSKLKYVN